MIPCRKQARAGWTAASLGCRISRFLPLESPWIWPLRLGCNSKLLLSINHQGHCVNCIHHPSISMHRTTRNKSRGLCIIQLVVNHVLVMPFARVQFGTVTPFHRIRPVATSAPCGQSQLQILRPVQIALREQCWKPAGTSRWGCSPNDNNGWVKTTIIAFISSFCGWHFRWDVMNLTLVWNW